MNNKLKQIIDHERWAMPQAGVTAGIKRNHNESLDRIESKARELLLPAMKPVLVKSYKAEALGVVFEIPQHHECPKCGMWLTRDYRVCSRGCCTIDWSEGGEA
jgi:hypothetical protein